MEKLLTYKKDELRAQLSRISNIVSNIQSHHLALIKCDSKDKFIKDLADDAFKELNNIHYILNDFDVIKSQVTNIDHEVERIIKIRKEDVY